jgi:hypothetical protein
MKLLDHLPRWILRRPSFAPYRAGTGHYDENYMWQVLNGCRKSYKELGFSDSFSVYTSLIDGLRDLPRTDILPLRELMQAHTQDRRLIGLRFDVDADPVTAIRMARHNARFGICGSFYLLHTAYYYGSIREGVLHRNPLLQGWLTDLIVAGCEIGLHTDPLSLYFEHGIDGADAVRQEILWLRQQGAQIDGTVAHNSVPLYGAENFEIFKGRSIWKRTRLKHRGVSVPLGVLDEQELKLTYEGNFASPVSDRPTREARGWLEAPLHAAIENESWMRCYLGEVCYRRATDAMVWHHGRGLWTLVSRLLDGKSAWRWKIGLADLLQHLRELPLGSRTSILMHPCYFTGDVAVSAA